jgi:hypothetical protein
LPVEVPLSTATGTVGAVVMINGSEYRLVLLDTNG